MAAPRSTSLRALRALSQQHSAAPFRRALHITGAYSAQLASGPDVTSIYLSRSLNDLRAECKRRNLSLSGEKVELVDRLSNHDTLQSRAFSIAMKRIDRHAFGAGSFAQESQTRPFNTSRANRAPNDASPIDLVYMPHTMEATSQSMPRVPTPPDSYTHYEFDQASELPLKAQIYTVSDLEADGRGPSAMSDVVDNHALDINPFNLTEIVFKAKSDAAASSGEDTITGAVKELCSGIMDTIKGPNPNSFPR